MKLISNLPRFLISGYLCIGGIGLIATSSWAQPTLDETATTSEENTSITDVAPGTSTQPSSANDEVNVPSSPATAPSPEAPGSNSSLPSTSEVPNTDVTGQGGATQDKAVNGPFETTPQNGLGSMLSSPKLQKIIRDNPQILELIKNNPQILELFLKNSAPAPK